MANVKGGIGSNETTKLLPAFAVQFSPVERYNVFQFVLVHAHFSQPYLQQLSFNNYNL